MQKVNLIATTPLLCIFFIAIYHSYKLACSIDSFQAVLAVLLTSARLARLVMMNYSLILNESYWE